VPLFIVVLSAVVISYTWAGNLVYRIAGETPPTPRANQPVPATANNNQPQVDLTNNLNSAWIRAEQQVTDWRSITVQLPASATTQLTFNIDSGTGGQPQNRAQLVLDRGEVVRWEPFSSYTRGRQLRSILRFAHTGEVAGIVGQTIAGLVSTGGAMLVFTGLALAIRRFLAWVASRSRSSKALSGVSNPVHDAAGD